MMPFSDLIGVVFHISTIPSKNSKTPTSVFRILMFFDKIIIINSVRQVCSIHPIVVFLCTPPIKKRIDMITDKLMKTSLIKPIQANATKVHVNFSISVNITSILYPTRIPWSLSLSSFKSLCIVRTIHVFMLSTNLKHSMPRPPYRCRVQLFPFSFNRSPKNCHKRHI